MDPYSTSPSGSASPFSLLASCGGRGTQPTAGRRMARAPLRSALSSRSTKWICFSPAVSFSRQFLAGMWFWSSSGNGEIGHIVAYRLRKRIQQ